MGNGERIPNQGQFVLKLDVDGDGAVNQLSSTFQVARVTRPLMSVSRICDAEMTATFDKNRAVVKDSKGRTVMTFKRHGGLYVCKMKLKPSALFARQGK